MSNLFQELRRRNVFRVAGVYAVIGWLMAQAGALLESALSLPHWFDAVIVSALLLGFPIALVLAWAFEVTPEGVRPTREVELEESITANTGRKLDYAIIIGLIIVVAVVVANRLLPEQPATGPATTTTTAAIDADGNTAPDASIAVLPFEDLSPRGDQGYFSDGMAEEILNVLADVPGLAVASRTSSFQFKGREIGVPEIAKQLNVRHILEGSVRKAGTTVRITAQLIDTKTDRHLWSETFDRPLTTDNVFTIQDEIAQAIVNAMAKSMGVKTPPKVTVAPATDNLTAYDLYLKARPLFQSRTRLIEADALLARAVEQDPGFVKAWEMRAALYAVIPDYGGTDKPIEKNLHKALEFVDRVLQLDPNSATAIAVRANVHMRENHTLAGTYDYGEIIGDLEKALTIDPHNLGALNWLGLTYADVGNLKGALASFRKCVAYEPLYSACAENVIVTLGELGRDKEAFATYEKSLNASVIKPVDTLPFPVLARLHKEVLFKTLMNMPTSFFGFRRQEEIYQAYLTPGHNDELAADMLKFARANSKLNEGELGCLILPVGAYDLTPFGLCMWDAAYAYYRRSPQFKAYIRKIGIEKYWREQGFPPQCQAVGNDDFECK